MSGKKVSLIFAGIVFAWFAAHGFSQSSEPQDSTGHMVVRGNARFTVITPYCLRLEYSKNGKFVDQPSYFALNRKSNAAFDVSEKNGETVIKTSGMELYYRPDGKAFCPQNLRIEIVKGNRKVTWKPGQRDHHNLGGAACTLDQWNGARMLPDGLLSQNGWHLIDDSRGPLLANNWVKARSKNAGIDWYLFGYGDNYKAALKSLTTVSGKVPLPRRYMLGAYYSRYWPYSSSDYQRIVGEYALHKFPLDVVVMDMDWHTGGWTGYTWNEKLIPSAKRLMQWFHQQKLHVTLNDHPADGVGPHESCYVPFMKALGENPATRKTIPFDAANHKYMKAFYEYTHAVHERIGVDFWWLDWQQSVEIRGIKELTNLAWLNEYFYRKSEVDGLRGASLSRWAGWGDQRHPIHFSGDAATTFQMLAFEVPFTAVSGNSGCFFWSHDIGGHCGDRNEESYARWCQFGAFSAALRSHSTRDSHLDRRPWTYPRWAERSMHISFFLRSIFFPYTYSAVRESCRDSLPLLRPMYLDWPLLEDAYRQPQQYLYGSSILVAPIVKAGEGPSRLASQTVWFPPENDWFNVFTGERYKGGQEVLTAATINEFPLYVKGGVPVPMQRFTQRMTTAPLDKLIICCYPGRDGQYGEFTLYEDDGVTQAYREKGEYRETLLRYSRDKDQITIQISPARGHAAGLPEKRSYLIELPGTCEASDATVDGEPARMKYSTKRHLNRIYVSARSVDQAVTVVVHAADANQSEICVKAFASRTGVAWSSESRKSFDDVMAAALSGAKSKQEKTAILAAAGTGAIMKNENVYGYPSNHLKLRRYGLAKDGKVTIPEVDALKLVRSKGRTKTLSLTDADVATVAFNLGGENWSLNIGDPRDLTTWSDNIAGKAKQTSSSGDPSGAVDRMVGGYPNGFGREWCSNRQKEGAWIKLEWPEPQAISGVMLFDRPNYNDQVLAGKVEFSNGSSRKFNSLENAAAQGVFVAAPSRKVSWLKVTITKTSDATQNVGLSEIVVLKK